MDNERRPMTDGDAAEIINELGIDRSSLYRRALGLPVRGRRAAIIDRALDARGLVRASVNPPQEAA